MATHVGVRNLLFLTLISMMLLVAGCVKQPEQPKVPPACQDACDFTGVQCDESTFSSCVDTNNDGCKEKQVVLACGKDYTCADEKTCTSPTEKRVLDVQAVAELEKAGVKVVEEGEIYQTATKTCSVLGVAQGEAIVACEEQPVSAGQDKYKIACTADCDRGVQVVAQVYQPITVQGFTDQFLVTLKNENPRKCAMSCGAYQGIYYDATQEGKNVPFTLTAGDVKTVTFRTNTPGNMQVLCSEVTANATSCDDRVREVLTSRLVIQPKTIVR